ncbi:MAG: GNAT family N-acetyltransferase [Chitinophagales bacterium]|nr:GNAT family N-acetyltransferase [Chitinophagales bacterium]
MSFIIRKGCKEDVPQMFRLVQELALFERAPEAVVNTERIMEQDGFGDNAIYKVFVAEDAATNQIVGMALYYTAYSTWKGKLLFLDDLIVTEKYRQFGIGRKLMNEFLKEAQRLGVNQVRWQVLDWNTPAIRFYESLKAELDREWITCKMSKQEIADYIKTINH